MKSLGALAEELIVSSLISEKMLRPHHWGARLSLVALMLPLAAGGLVFLAVALDRRLELHTSPDVAALAAALLLFLCAAAAWATARVLGRARATHLTAARRELGANVRMLIDDVCAELEDPVRDNPKTAVLIASLAGFLTAPRSH
jgi:hypothetical protein